MRKGRVLKYKKTKGRERGVCRICSKVVLLRHRNAKELAAVPLTQHPAALVADDHVANKRSPVNCPGTGQPTLAL